MIELIGAPTKESIRVAVKAGLVKQGEVGDALRFETNQTVSVARRRPDSSICPRRTWRREQTEAGNGLAPTKADPHPVHSNV